MIRSSSAHPRMHDTIIVGGGPGGLYTSLLLARAGFDVVVLEEHTTSGEPVHCTGVLAAEAYDEFDLPREAMLNSLRTVRFYPPCGTPVDYTTPAVEAVVVDRLLFDRGLYGRARSAGVTIETGAKVTSLTVNDKDVVVRVGNGRELRARSCVLACGASYSLQHRLNLGAPAVQLQSAQIELPALRSGAVEVHLGERVAPKGFAWIVPVVREDGMAAKVGLMCDSNAARFFKLFLSRVSVRWGLNPAAVAGAGAPRYKLLPLAPIRRTFADRVLAVGDAAGLVKATTGGGIYYSLVSAAAAAEVLSDALQKDTLRAATLKAYETRWRQRLGAELRAQLALRMLAHRLGDPDIEALFELARTDGVMPLVSRFGRFNNHRDLIVSLFKHPPARRVLFKQLVAKSLTLAVR